MTAEQMPHTESASVLSYIRAGLFYAVFYPVMFIYSLLCVCVGWALPFRARFRLITVINFFCMFWLRVTCGVKVEIEGRENLPKDGAYVVVANHSSEWETFFLQTLIRPQCTVLKQELLRIPGFGWALGMLKPIALDRSKRRGALKQLITQGKERLQEGINIVIFPQGTRLPVGQLGKFNKGGAMLAAANNVPLVPLVHDAGLYWPGKSFVKRPGTVKVIIGKPVELEEPTVDALHDPSVEWMEAQLRALKVVD